MRAHYLNLYIAHPVKCMLLYNKARLFFNHNNKERDLSNIRKIEEKRQKSGLKKKKTG